MNSESEAITQWSKHTLGIQFLMNTRCNRIYKVSPFCILNGYEPDDLMALQFKDHVTNTSHPLHLPDWFARQTGLLNVHEDIAKMLEEQHAQDEKRLNDLRGSKVTTEKIPIGSRVYIKNEADRKAGAPPLIGPYIITDVDEFNSYNMRHFSKLNQAKRKVPRHMIKVISKDPNSTAAGEFIIKAIVNVRDVGTANEMYHIRWAHTTLKTWQLKKDIHEGARKAYIEKWKKAGKKPITVYFNGFEPDGYK